MIDSGALLLQVARWQRPEPRQLMPRAEAVVGGESEGTEDEGGEMHCGLDFSPVMS